MLDVSKQLFCLAIINLTMHEGIGGIRNAKLQEAKLKNRETGISPKTSAFPLFKALAR